MGLEKDCGFYSPLNRSPLQCRNRWHNHLAYPDAKRREWESYEDELLKKAVNQSGGEWDWEKIADSTPLLNRSPAQCCNRWHNHLAYPDAERRRIMGVIRLLQLLKKALINPAASGLEKVIADSTPCLTVLRCSAAIDGITISCS